MKCVIDRDQVTRIQLDILSRTLLAGIENKYSCIDEITEAWKRTEAGKAWMQREKDRADGKLPKPTRACGWSNHEGAPLPVPSALC